MSEDQAAAERATQRWTEVAHRRAFVVVVVVAGWFRLWQASVSAQFWPDSERYQLVAQQPLWSSGFLVGERPPGLPLLWKLTGSPGGFVRVQAVLAVAAWAWLAWVVGRSMRTWVAASVASLAVLGFSLTGPVLQWDTSVLTETLSIAAIAGLYAVTFEAARATTWRWLARLALVAVVGVALRDSQVVVVVVVGVAAGVLAWRGSLDAERRRFAAYAAVVLLAVAGVAGQAASDEGRLAQNVAGVFAVRVFPYPSRVAWFADHGMPQAKEVDARAAKVRSDHGRPRTLSVSPFDQGLAPLFDWLIHDGQSAYEEYLVTHPAYLLGEPFRRPERTFNNTGHLSRYVGRDGTDLHLGWLFWPAWPVAVAEAVAVAALVTWRGSWRSRLVRATAGLAALGLLAMLVAWHADGQETARHTIEGQAQVRLGVLLLLLLALGRQPWGSSSSIRLPNGSDA